jgi:hypothetical protein
MNLAFDPVDSDRGGVRRQSKAEGAQGIEALRVGFARRS